MQTRLLKCLAVIGFAGMIGPASAENAIPVPDIVHDHGDLRIDLARWNNSDRFISATLRDVERTAEIVIECLPNDDLMSVIFFPGFQLISENPRALSLYVNNQRTQFSARPLRDNGDTLVFVDYDHLRAKPKRTRRFAETLWKGTDATLEFGQKTWRFDLSSSRVGLLLVAEVCGVAMHETLRRPPRNLCRLRGGSIQHHFNKRGRILSLMSITRHL